MIAKGWAFVVSAGTRGGYDPIAGPFFIFASGRYWIRNSSGIPSYPSSVAEVFSTKILLPSILIAPGKAPARGVRLSGPRDGIYGYWPQHLDYNALAIAPGFILR